MSKRWFRSALHNELPEDVQVRLEDQQDQVLDALLGFKESLLSEGVDPRFMNQIFTELKQQTLKPTTVEQGEQ